MRAARATFLAACCCLAAAAPEPAPRLRGAVSPAAAAQANASAEAEVAALLAAEPNSSANLTVVGQGAEVNISTNLTMVDEAQLSLESGSTLLGGSAAAGAKCMCLFDIDRTLTCKQGHGCPGCQAFPGVWDDAYGGGSFTMSPLAQHIGSSGCGGCVLGAVSAGSGGSGAAREKIRAALRGGPLVLGCSGPNKPSCSRGLAQRYGVPLANVYFFDDTPANVFAFSGSGMNAHVVSCGSRDASIGGGLCGAQPGEVSLVAGVAGCR